MSDIEEFRNKVIRGDCLEVLKRMPANSIDAVVTDPPYGLSEPPDMKEVLTHWLAGEEYEHGKAGFMSAEWDSFVPGPKVWKEIMRVLKPGGHIMSFSSTRTYDLMVTAMRLAGVEVRDSIGVHCEFAFMLDWVHGCLSEDTEILIDGQWEPYQQATAGRKALCYDVAKDSFGWQTIETLFVYDYKDTAYRIQSDETDQIVSKNHRCLVERTGKLDFCEAESLGKQERVPVLESTSGELPLSRHNTLATVTPTWYEGKVWCVKVPTGAFVARRNGKVFVTGNSGFPKSLNIGKSLEKDGKIEEAKAWVSHGTALKPAREPIACFTKADDDGVIPEFDTPEGERLYYCAKASTSERNKGCEHLFWMDGVEVITKDEYDAKQAENERRKDESGYKPHRVMKGNNWPTVKPLRLCSYLVRMVKMPKGSLILDPFCGSGTTLVACVLEGCDFVGIDKDPVACEISEARVRYFQKNRDRALKLLEPPKEEGEKAVKGEPKPKKEAAPDAPKQGELFAGHQR